MFAKAFIAIGLCFFSGLSTLYAAGNPEVGSKAPFFKVKSGENKVLSLDMLIRKGGGYIP
jgi:hypothetical protein